MTSRIFLARASLFLGSVALGAIRVFTPAACPAPASTVDAGVSAGGVVVVGVVEPSSVVVVVPVVVVSPVVVVVSAGVGATVAPGTTRPGSLP